MFYFSFFLEAIPVLFVSDLLYGASEPKWAGVRFVSLILASILFIIIETAKNKFTFHR